MAEVEKLGSSIPIEVSQQLDVRGDLFSNPGKNSQQIQTINSNTGWVKLRSSVNTLTDSQTLALFSNGDVVPTGDSTIAEDNILFGGLTKYGGTLYQGVELPDLNPNPAYRKQDSLGFRPMGGITNFSVKSKGSYGVVQEATVDFSVWSVEELSKFEQLYFRPGFTALVEWGHTTYLDNSGNIQQASVNSTSISDHDFFRKDGFDIDGAIASKKDETFGNYDGMFGFIINFSWKFRKDGGYDCSVRILSKSAVLQGLLLPKNSDGIDADPNKGEDTEESSAVRKSLLHRLLSTLEDNSIDPDDTPVFDGKQHLTKKFNNLVKNLQDFKVFVTDMDLKSTWNDDDIRLCFIPLRALIDMVNVFGTLKSPVKNNQKPLPEFRIEYGEKFATFPDHFTSDPIISFPPRIPKNEPYRDYIITKNKLAQSYQDNIGTEEGFDEVLNIPVSTYFIREELEKALSSSDDSEKSILNFLTGVLSGIQRAFGNINEFGLYVVDDKYRVADRNKFIAKKDEVRTIDLTGLRSTISDLNIESKISNDIASMVAISAQGDSGNYHENVATILEWNYGLVDRHYKIKAQGDYQGSTNNPVTSNADAQRIVREKKQQKEREQKYLADLSKAWKHFNDESFWVDQYYDEELFNNVRQESTAQILKMYKENRIKKKLPPQGVIPVELSLTMLGLSGFKIGTTFRINKGILPEKYNQYGFIITGISHNIGTDNKWTTTLQTQFFSLRDITKDETDISKQNRPEQLSQSLTQGEEENTQDTPNADRLREVLRELGYSEKGNELSNGGDITAQTANYGIAVSRQIKQEYPSIQITFTGGNDQFHQNLPYNSRHKSGRGLDLVINPPTPRNISGVKTILQGHSAGNNPNARFLDEYSKPTVKASGKHFHISWGPGTEGNEYLAEANRLAAEGKIKTYKV